MLALIGNLGPLETVLIVLVVILVFGGRLPEVARQTIKVMARVRSAIDELKREVNFDGEMRQIDAEVRRERPHYYAPAPTIEAETEPRVESKESDDSTSSDT